MKSLGVTGEDELRGLPRPELKRRPAAVQQQDEKPTPTLNQTMRDWAQLKAESDGRTRITDFKFTTDGSSILAAYCRGGCYDNTQFVRLSAFPSGKDPVRLWDVQSGQLVWERLLDPEGVFERIVLSPDNKRFAASDKRPGLCKVGLYEVRTGQFVHSLPQIHFPLASPTILFTHNSQYFITFRAEDGTAKFQPWKYLAMYDTSSGKMTAQFSNRNAVRDADLSSDGRWLASTTWRGWAFQIWDMGTREVVMTRIPKGWTWAASMVRIRFSPDGRRLVVTSNKPGWLAVFQFEP